MGLEEVRQENIRRNRELLQQLQLDSLGATVAPKAKKAAKPKKSAKVEKKVPTRRLRRLAGPRELTDEEKQAEQVAEAERERQERMKERRLMKIEGDFAFHELLADAHGALLHEDQVYDNVKLEDDGEELSLGAGPPQCPAFDKMTLVRGEKVVPHRITTLHTMAGGLICAGDTNGNVGFWGSDTVLLRPHGRSVTKIVGDQTAYSSSYDGSVRLYDAEKLVSGSVLSLESGILDICINGLLLYVATMDGEFCQHDVRTQFKKKMLRMHDKKIGGITVNPSSDYQVATASLDRTVRVWDLRKTQKQKWSDFGLLTFPALYGACHALLSVSTVDWSASDNLVCNGYDNLVRVFHSPAQGNLKDPEQDTLSPDYTVKHNCQSGRWVLILKARWQPNPHDGVQKFAIANMQRSIDVYDHKGKLLRRLQSEEMTAVPAVVSFHPLANQISGGSASGKVYVFN